MGPATTSAQQHVLISVLGRTPQILTETLYALGVVRRIALHEVWVISTREGCDAAVAKLLHPHTGQIHRLKQDYPESFCHLLFTAEQILVAQDGLMPVADIRNREQSEIFLELIMRVLWEKSRMPGVTLHCSLAGGRKTMSTYLALALQLLGRPQDALYHVLVDPPELENHPQFYYPPPSSCWLALNNGQQVDISRAQIDLVEIPFIHLRERVQVDRLSSPVGYRQLLEWAQSELDQTLTLPPLILDHHRRVLRIGESEIQLQPQRFCLYWYFADRSRQRPGHVSAEVYAAYFEYPQSPYFSRAMRDGLLARFDILDPSGQMRDNFIEKVLDGGELPMSWVLQTIARINEKLRKEIAKASLLPFYRVSPVGKRGRKCYGIKLEGRKIVVPEAKV